jgi:hypothetical protein
MRGAGEGVYKAEWSEVDAGRCGKVMRDVAVAVPFMSLREVDETLRWMKEEWMRLGVGRKMVWGRLKRREEELLGRKLGSGRERPGAVVTMTVEQAKELDRLRAENRRLREEAAGKVQ